ncbi:hypothetical protein I317_00839 [Kwoniella heveanensis CBS 569]|nr:hypothetical protein I317_00839 [Kwoniella heveanensis CBS 569]
MPRPPRGSRPGRSSEPPTSVPYPYNGHATRSRRRSRQRQRQRAEPAIATVTSASEINVRFCSGGSNAALTEYESGSVASPSNAHEYTEPSVHMIPAYHNDTYLPASSSAASSVVVGTADTTLSPHQELTPRAAEVSEQSDDDADDRNSENHLTEVLDEQDKETIRSASAALDFRDIITLTLKRPEYAARRTGADAGQLTGRFHESHGSEAAWREDAEVCQSFRNFVGSFYGSPVGLPRILPPICWPGWRSFTNEQIPRILSDASSTYNQDKHQVQELYTSDEDLQTGDSEFALAKHQALAASQAIISGMSNEQVRSRSFPDVAGESLALRRCLESELAEDLYQFYCRSIGPAGEYSNDF